MILEEPFEMIQDGHIALLGFMAVVGLGIFGKPLPKIFERDIALGDAKFSEGYLGLDIAHDLGGQSLIGNPGRFAIALTLRADIKIVYVAALVEFTHYFYPAISQPFNIFY